ncbi:MAG TPA: ABC transporter permease [Firmicutes bacterium]|nr:ABC transporter permease [Bacillota bacterium]
MLTFFLLLFLVPVVLIIINSFKNEAEFYARGVLSLPLKPSLNIFREVWQLVEFDVKLFNSLLISSAVACLGLVISVMNAYAIGIGKIRWDKMVLIFFAFAMVIPHEALAYPLYYLMKMVGLYDTKLAVILIFAVLQSAYGTYLLSSVFRTFPDSLLEAAKIDGCNKWQTLFIVIALNKPALGLLMVFYFIWTFNEFFLPLIFLVSNANQTIPIAVTLFQGQYTGYATMQSACALLGILPCLVFFLIFQRTLTRGLVTGGIKG